MRRNDWGWAAYLLTIANAFFGFWAIVLVVEGDYLTACWLIITASICDGLDGKLARFTRSSSEIGIEMDSLADVISFGTAPAVLLYFTSFHKFGFIGVVMASVPLIFGALRLARFNVGASIGEKHGYLGLPIPMMANTIATFIIFNFALWGNFQLEILLFPFTVFLALLMVSHLPYDHMPRFTFKDTRKNLVKLIAILVGILIIALKPSVIFFPLLLIYVAKGISNSIFGLAVEDIELEEAMEDESAL